MRQDFQAARYYYAVRCLQLVPTGKNKLVIFVRNSKVGLDDTSRAHRLVRVVAHLRVTQIVVLIYYAKLRFPYLKKV